MTQLLEKLTEFFRTNPQSQLEQFIASKHPTNTADVEHWTREYEQRNSFYWSRGL